MRVKYVVRVMCACFAGASFSVNAALVTGDVLEFTSNSYFALDSNANGSFDLPEQISISMNEGIRIGAIQTASGSHNGAPNSSELPSIDSPWNFKANTGMHTSSSPITVVNDLGGGVMELDFSGWGLTWAGIPFISLGGGFQDCGVSDDGICVDGNGDDIAGQFNNGTSIATITCSSVLCSQGDTYTLEYTAIVPQADSSNFGGVSYGLHLEGTISAVPIPSAVWLFGSGLLGLIGAVRRK